MALALVPPDPELQRTRLAAYEAFFEQTYKELVGRAILLGCARAEAEDVVQEVLMRMWKKWDSIETARRRPHALVSVHHAVTDRHRAAERRRKHWPLVVMEFGRSRWAAHDPFENDFQGVRELNWMLEKLSPRQREVLLLTADGFDAEAIADALGMDPTSVRTHLSRARQKLRGQLEGRKK
jgi:RNA polymerase sigma factor (sigma-70 family)